MANKIKLRRDTGANWTLNNPILSVGEIGINVDTNNFKIGNGTTNWNSLGYVLKDATESIKGIVELATDGENAAGVAVQGNDSRLSDARTPTGHSHVKADITDFAHTHVAADITDFDTEVSNNSAVAANTAKVTNATHTGDVTGDTALTIDSTAISGKTSVTPANGMEVLVNDAGTLKKSLVDDFLGGGGGSTVVGDPIATVCTPFNGAGASGDINITTGCAYTESGDISLVAGYSNTTGTTAGRVCLIGGYNANSTGTGGSAIVRGGNTYGTGGVVFIDGGTTQSTSGKVGGAVNIAGGYACGTSTGGQALLSGGISYNGTGGKVCVRGGTAGGTGTGGNAEITGGQGCNAGGTAGNVIISGGSGYQTHAGEVRITSGSSTYCNTGNINIYTKNSTYGAAGCIIINPAGNGSTADSQLLLCNLPTSAPTESGAVWNNAGVLNIV